MENTTAKTVPARRYQELSQRTILAKWKTPEEELTGMAGLAGSLVERGLSEAKHVCLIAPNRTWGTQLARACAEAGTRATLCMPPSRMSTGARRVLATIDLIAHPDDERLPAAWAKAYGSEQEARELIENYANADAFSLMRVTGIRKHPEFQHALTKIVGDERPPAFSATIHDQLLNPTIADDCEEIPIMHFQRARGDFEHVLFVACVDGLVPGARVLEQPDEEKRAEQIRESERAFEHAVALGRKRAVISYFTRIEKSTATRAHIPFPRAKHEGERVMAMVQPTPFLNDWGLDRPSTIGGQSLMRMYGLN